MTHFYNLGITSCTQKNNTASGLGPGLAFTY